MTSFKGGLAEPTIGVDKNGLAVAAGGRFDSLIAGLAHSHVYRSKDGGMSWQELGARTEFAIDLPTDLDPYIYVDPDFNRIYEVPLTYSGAVINRSDDGGETWSTSYIAAAGKSDHQTVVAAKPPVKAPLIKPSDERYPKIFYYCVNSTSHQPCSRSTDGGDTFQPTLTPA